MQWLNRENAERRVNAPVCLVATVSVGGMARGRCARAPRRRKVDERLSHARPEALTLRRPGFLTPRHRTANTAPIAMR
ncbi:unnamed protein product, partial [Iphiclides podalirius]